MPGLEPLAPHRQPKLDRRSMRWRFLAAAVLTVLAMIAVAALLMVLPITD
jgi:type IV secretory pathway component VirB8